MRIMDTAAASNVIMGQNGPSSQAQLQLPQQPQQSLLGFGNFQSNMLQQNALSHQAQLLQQTQQPQSLQLQQQQQQQQTPFGVLQAQSGSMANGSVLGTGMLGFGNFLNSMGGSNGSGL
ncbi:hypothetical protein BGZ54_000895 [Gamsiella multidivaricata]|nr:hypothetical protein BGZ54_000895 [Gamsiella multidivaricata]